MPGLGRSPGEGNGNSLQYSRLENSMGRRAWGLARVHGVAKSWIWLSNKHFHFYTTLTGILHSNYTLYYLCQVPISLHFSSVTQSCLTLCDPMDCSTPGLPVHRQLPEFTQTHVHWVGDAIQPSHPLSSPFPPTFNFSQYHGIFQWVSASHQVATALAFQLQHQSFQLTFRIDFL